MFNRVIQGDCLIKLKELEDNSVDSIVTDPPYELGFMGKSWDNTGIANNVEMWKECLRVLKPGGHLLTFSGTRTYHRMASAIEDAGFEVRDMIEWVYSTGFPKSLNIAKSIESKLKTGSCAKNNFHQLEGERRDGRIGMYDTVEEHGFRKVNPDQLGAFDLEATTQEAKQWEGWGTALKPAHEPICMARKPIQGTVAENCLKWGTGGINIDESRVSTDYYLQGNDLSDIISICQLNHLQSSANNAELKKFQDDTTNVIKNLFSVAENVDMPILEKTLGRLQEDTTRMDIQCYEEMLGDNISTSLNMYTLGRNITEQSRKDLKYIISTVLKMITDWKIYNVSAYQLTEVLLTRAKNEVNTREKSARFPANFIHDNSEEVRECFPDSKAGKNKEEKGTGGIWNKGTNLPIGPEYGDSGSASRFFKSIIYQAKASKSERNKGCEEMEAKVFSDRNPELDSADMPQNRSGNAKQNFHPTVKPIALMEYLIKMVTKPGGIVLDPFAGSGSTLVAAKQNGFNYIGIEMTEEYIPIIEARLK